RMSWAHIQELNLQEEDAEHDCYFYVGKSTAMSIRPGMFYIMFPSDGHKPGCHQEFPKHYRKVVVKLPVIEN
ncbi:MAG: YhcH/YjgK/YiaL family protein, partial [Clostridia bacterium]|nr:YhcH/YjgK/YiaL family protein [Clostridia bacterium]